jgi:WD40 repeat protein
MVKMLAALTQSNRGEIALYDVATAKLLRTIAPEKDRIGRLAFTPDGKHVVAVQGEQNLTFWDTKTGQLSRTIDKIGIDAHALAFAPDGKTLAIAGGEQGIHLWDLPPRP